MAILIQDGFETGDTSLWTGETGTPVVNAVAPLHHGVYSMKCDASGDYVQKTIDEIEVYARIYCQFTVLPPSDTNALSFLRFDDSSLAADVSLYNDAGTVKWRLSCRDGWGSTTSLAATGVPAINTWVCLKLRHLKDNAVGGAWLTVDGVAATSITDKDTNNGGNTVQIRVGNIVSYYGTTITVDCVDAQTTDVACEGAGGPTVRKGSCVPAMTALLSKFSALKQPREPKFQPHIFPKFTPRTLI